MGSSSNVKFPSNVADLTEERGTEEIPQDMPWVPEGV
eukprot:CAMPEP_0194574112 /NCGR_PEP_ID=MMETSP0292-20121207/10097_1 /TAXON_ID=39354 /ORGANISM="Heterosigma akashiwo, Strain CCMP2393" /LENGTH=36 /DNA_ID= /DNA_START= /DNA_END= /DNA_ORIENTATION=